MDVVDRFGPAYWVGAGTLLGYLVILAVMTMLLFVLPYLLFIAT